MRSNSVHGRRDAKKHAARTESGTRAYRANSRQVEQEQTALKKGERGTHESKKSV
jgi:hypothetical protein